MIVFFLQSRLAQPVWGTLSPAESVVVRCFLAILCSLRPDLVDLSQAQTNSHRENLERAFHLAEKELGIPRLLEPEGKSY